MGHLEYISAIEQFSFDSEHENLLVSVSGDKTIRLWNYLDATEQFRYELCAPGLHLAQNQQHRNQFAVSIVDANQKIGFYELVTTENKLRIQKIVEYELDANVKHVNSMFYESNEQIWLMCHCKDDDILLKTLKIQMDGKIFEENEDNLMSILKKNVISTKIPLLDDISLLFKKKIDTNYSEYHDRKKRRLEEKKNK